MIKKGFTLAEVLTTLMVIGVVAAMTIPSLLNTTGESQARTAAKKAASVLGQATQMLSAADETCNITADTASVNLTSCMARVLQGTVSAAGNAITTPDGMIYTFYAPARTGTIATVCGTATGARCGVIVDTNGVSRGSNNFEYPATDAINGAGIPEAVAQEATWTSGTDIIAFDLSESGARIHGFVDGTNTGVRYILGDDAATNYAAATLCIDAEADQPVACEHDNAVGYVIPAANLMRVNGGNCPNGTKAVNWNGNGGVVVGADACPPEADD